MPTTELLPRARIRLRHHLSRDQSPYGPHVCRCNPQGPMRAVDRSRGARHRGEVERPPSPDVIERRCQGLDPVPVRRYDGVRPCGRPAPPASLTALHTARGLPNGCRSRFRCGRARRPRDRRRRPLVERPLVCNVSARPDPFGIGRPEKPLLPPRDQPRAASMRSVASRSAAAAVVMPSASARRNRSVSV